MSALKDFQDIVGNWGNSQFPQSTPTSILAHLKKEVDEFIESGDPEEGADCFMLLLHWFYRHNIDLLETAKEKFNIIIFREWGEPDKNGVIEHIKKE